MSLSETAATWESLGAADPLWAVLSTEEGRDGRWDEAAFFATGVSDVAWLAGLVERSGGRFAGRALDFGCGVGRLSRALAERVDHVVGLDVAGSMIARAAATNPAPDRIEFVHSVARDLPFPDGTFDLVVSLIVLQHVPPALSVRYLLEFGRVLRPGGVLAVQLPSGPAVPEPLPEQACRAVIEVLAAPAALRAGEAAKVRLRLHNRADLDWPAGCMLKLGNHWLAEGTVKVSDDGRFELPAVAAGTCVDAELRVCAPAVPGRYELEFDVVQEFVGWWADLGNETARRPIVITPAAPADPGPAAAPVGDSMIEIHPIRRDVVCALLGYAGCDVLAVEPDGLTGPGWNSYTYVARARPGA